jgi:hypothetical protein
MKPNNSNQQSNREGQQNNQPQQDQQPAMNPPEAAAKSDLERVEKRAREADVKADGAQERCEMLEREVSDLRTENEILRDYLGRTIGALHRIDQHLSSVEENIGAWGNSYETEEIAEMFDLPDPNEPMYDDVDDEDPAVEADEITVPFADDEEE